MMGDLDHGSSCPTWDPNKDENCVVHYLAEDLPHPLPTLEKIKKAGSSFPTSFDHNKLATFEENNYIVKTTEFDTFEGWTMLYLKKMTSIPVPSVYAILTDKKATPQRTIIVMEYIQGPTLQNTWAGLEVSQKEDIAKQLAANFAELRALPSPGSFGRSLPPEFGNLPNKSLQDFIFHSDRLEGPGDFGGPFDTVEQLSKGLGDCIQDQVAAAFAGNAKFLAGFIPKILPEGPPVFTHGDLQLQNMVLRDDGRVSIIDWGLSGWYPACWEYCYAVYASQFDKDWAPYIPKFLDEYPSECCLTLILRDMHRGAII